MAQLPLPDAELEATNGHMLGMLLRHAAYERLPPHRGGEREWAALLRFCVERGASALIDAGALLAGVELADAGAMLLGLLREAGSPLQAVVYFQRTAGGQGADGGEWVLADSLGRRWPLRLAPVRERDAFVVFDERHCRGSDMKLRPEASAVLTLGPGMAKDKLMQAAGRLRKLGAFQTLLVTAARDVHDRLAAAAAGRSGGGGGVEDFIIAPVVVGGGGGGLAAGGVTALPLLLVRLYLDDVGQKEASRRSRSPSSRFRLVRRRARSSSPHTRTHSGPTRTVAPAPSKISAVTATATTILLGGAGERRRWGSSASAAAPPRGPKPRLHQMHGGRPRLGRLRRRCGRLLLLLLHGYRSGVATFFVSAVLFRLCHARLEGLHGQRGTDGGRQLAALPRPHAQR